MKKLLSLLAIASLLPLPVFAASQASIDQAAFSQAFCDRFTANTWMDGYVDEQLGPDFQIWTFLRDGTFRYSVDSDYVHNASGKWFLKKASKADAAEIYILITEDDSGFGGLYSDPYSMTFEDGKLHMKSEGGGRSYHLTQGKANEGQPSACIPASPSARRVFQVFEKLSASTWKNDGISLYAGGELEFNDVSRGTLEKGNLDIIPEKKLLVMKGHWKQYPLATRPVELAFRYFFRGKRLILKFADNQKEYPYVLPYVNGDTIILNAL